MVQLHINKELNKLIKMILEPVTRSSIFWDMFQSIFGTNEFKKKVLGEYIKLPGRVLEIGCATGNIAEIFGSFDYTGIDIDGSYIEMAKKKNPQSNYKFYCVDVLNSPLPINYYDYIVLSHIAHHLSDDYFEKIIDVSHSLLKAGGYLVILDMIKPLPEDSFGKRLYYRLDRGVYIRKIEEFVNFFINKASLFKQQEIRIIKCKKWNIQVIDQCLIKVQKLSL